MRTLLICLLVCSASFSFAQSGKDFAKYARVQDSLFVDAYKKQDTKLYESLLKDFLTRYDKLSKEEQQENEDALQNAYYNLSCTYSLLNNKPAALSYLAQAIDAHYYDYGHMQEDSDLDNIRGEQAFKTQMERIRKIGDYGYILKHAKTYNTADNRAFPKFTYQPSDNPKLAALRKGFHLDSIAGDGNDVLKVINLMHWMHNYIPHDGQHGNPSVYDAERMIAVCKKDNRGLNCRGLATVLNECYLAMGYPSRLVTCLPKDSLKIDSDCHVINAVYISSLKKWVWMDPTNNAYVMNEKGELLGIEEVRERLINDQPLILNPDANWNNKEGVSKEHYLENYMAKNLYKIECPVNSAWNLEGRDAGKKLEYVTLIPVEHYEQTPDKEEYPNEKNKTLWIYYKTNNPDLFWAAP